jgi:hypothetical protein
MTDGEARRYTTLSRRALLVGAGLWPLLSRVARGANIGPQVHISYGQSWRSNAFPSFARFRINPQPRLLLACHVPSVGHQGAPLPAFASGPLPNSAGINLPSMPDGITGYAPDDLVTIGRCAVLAQQALREAGGTAPRPILEFCAAFPGSTWTTGGGGGLHPGGTSWRNMLRIIAAINAMQSNGKPVAASYRSIGYTQGGSEYPHTPDGKVGDLTAMLRDFDGLDLPGTAAAPLCYYLGIAAPRSDARSMDLSALGTYAFCRANAPGAGGRWSGRVFATTPWYQWPLTGHNALHTNAYGTARHGEFEGYAKYVAEDEGRGRFTPLWDSLSRPITRRGQTITVPFDRPAGAGFARGVLTWFAEPSDGIARAPAFGWAVRRDGRFLTISPSLRGMEVELHVTESLSPRDVVEISYAVYGPGGPNPGTHSGVWGNLAMAGPASTLFPGKPINAWAWPFVKNITV